MTKLRTLVTSLSLGLIVLVGGFYAWNSGLIINFKDSSSSHDGHSHSHADLEPVEANQPYPTLDVSLEQQNGDRVLRLETRHFAFKSPVDTRAEGTKIGHAHLTVDGESFAMFYDERYALPKFMPGTYNLEVTLNENESHAPLAVNGSVVSDTILMKVDDQPNK